MVLYDSRVVIRSGRISLFWVYMSFLLNFIITRSPFLAKTTMMNFTFSYLLPIRVVLLGQQVNVYTVLYQDSRNLLSHVLARCEAECIPFQELSQPLYFGQRYSVP